MSARRRNSPSVRSSVDSTPTPSPRRLGLRARDSGAYDLGLMQQGDETSGSEAGRDAPLFALEEMEGEKIKASHVLGTLFVFAVFSMLAYLMFPGVLNGDVTNSLSTCGIALSDGNGDSVGKGLDVGKLPFDWMADPAVQSMVERFVEERLETYNETTKYLKEGYLNLTQLMESLRKDQDMYSDIKGEAESVAGSGQEATLRMLRDLQELKTNLESQQTEQHNQRVHELEGLMADYEAIKAQVEHNLEAVQEKTEELEARMRHEAHETSALEEKVAALSLNVSALEDSTARGMDDLTSALRGLQVEETEKLLLQARETTASLGSRVQDMKDEQTKLHAAKEAWGSHKVAAEDEAKSLLSQVTEAREELARLVSQSQLEMEGLQRSLQAAGDHALSPEDSLPKETVEAVHTVSLSVSTQLSEWKGIIAATLESNRLLTAHKAEVESRMQEAQKILETIESTAADAAAAMAAAKADVKEGGFEGQSEVVERLEGELESLRNGQATLAAAVQRSFEMVQQARSGMAIEAEKASGGEEAAGSAVLAGVTAEDVKRWFRETLSESQALQDQAGEEVCAPETVASLVERTVRLYEADAVGLVDYAAATAGGKVLPSLSSATYTPPGQLLSTDTFHAWGFKAEIGTRDLVIRAGHKRPGQCWPMAGSRGQVTVQLLQAVRPFSVSLEHIPPEISQLPSTAPQRFRVLGRKIGQAAESPVVLHSQEYLTYEMQGPRPVQTFPLDLGGGGEGVRAVTLEVLSNWGYAEYTCLYRFRVHGEVVGEREAVVMGREEGRGEEREDTESVEKEAEQAVVEDKQGTAMRDGQAESVRDGGDPDGSVEGGDDREGGTAWETAGAEGEESEVVTAREDEQKDAQEVVSMVEGIEDAENGGRMRTEGHEEDVVERATSAAEGKTLEEIM